MIVRSVDRTLRMTVRYVYRMHCMPGASSPFWQYVSAPLNTFSIFTAPEYCYPPGRRCPTSPQTTLVCAPAGYTTSKPSAHGLAGHYPLFTIPLDHVSRATPDPQTAWTHPRTKTADHWSATHNTNSWEDCRRPAVRPSIRRRPGRFPAVLHRPSLAFPARHTWHAARGCHHGWLTHNMVCPTASPTQTPPTSVQPQSAACGGGKCCAGGLGLAATHGQETRCPAAPDRRPHTLVEVCQLSVGGPSRLQVWRNTNRHCDAMRCIPLTSYASSARCGFGVVISRVSRWFASYCRLVGGGKVLWYR